MSSERGLRDHAREEYEVRRVRAEVRRFDEAGRSLKALDARRRLVRAHAAILLPPGRDA